MRHQKIGCSAMLTSMILTSSPQKVLGETTPVVHQEQQNQQEFQQSAVAASAWLSLVDKENYAGSWDAGSLTFQLTIPKNEWIKTMNIARKPLGNVLSRDLIRQDPAFNPKNLPAGAYRVIYYKTSFSNRNEVHERLILQQQNNGQWKMLTYDVS